LYSRLIIQPYLIAQNCALYVTRVYLWQSQNNASIMRKIFRSVWVAICICIMAAYLLSCLTFIIPPSAFSFISLFALAFPFLFVAAIFCCLTFLFTRKKTALITFMVIIIAGFKNLHNTVAISTTKWQMEKAPGALRVMTWNTEHFLYSNPVRDPLSKPRLAMYEAIKQYNPDILCVQEFIDIANDSYMVSVRKDIESFGYTFDHFSIDSVLSQYKPVIVYQGVAIFSRVPLTSTGKVNIVNKGVNENLIYADIEYNKQKLRIFTAHLLSYALYIDTIKNPTVHQNIYELTYERKRNVQAKVRQAEIVHEKEVEIIRSTMARSPYPIIYCGDINSTPASYTYNRLKDGLNDAFIKKGFGIGTTFYKISPTLRIDVCLFDDKLQALQCTVPQLYLSDHFPVVADFTWKN
jgi:endonuclease/exonuclease/phosphatase family metal-dependent hydrolase